MANATSTPQESRKGLGGLLRDLPVRPRHYLGEIMILLLHALVILLPNSRLAVPWCIAGITLFWLFHNSFADKVEMLRRRWRFLLLFLSIYLIELAGMLVTENTDMGWTLLGRKASLVLFPIVLLSTGLLNRKRVERILYSYVYGCLAAVLFAFGRAFYYFYRTGELHHFYYYELTFDQHPTYFAMYLCFAMGIIIKFVFDQQDRVKWHLFLILTVFILGVFQLSSRSGILTLAGILTFTFFYLIVPRIRWRRSLLGLILAMGFSSLVLYNSNYTFDRFAKLTGELVNKDEQGHASGSAGVRLIIWKSGLETFKQHPLTGVGTGDAEEEFQSHYERLDLTKAQEKNLNAHNQFVQTGVAVGIFGLLALVFNLAIPFVLSFKYRHLIYGFFAFVVGFNFLTESMLERQAGIVFFALFQSLLFFGFFRQAPPEPAAKG